MKADPGAVAEIAREGLHKNPARRTVNILAPIAVAG
jgi:hypothetical protein